jgi:hypothetical protein
VTDANEASTSSLLHRRVGRSLFAVIFQSRRILGFKYPSLEVYFGNVWKACCSQMDGFKLCGLVVLLPCATGHAHALQPLGPNKHVFVSTLATRKDGWSMTHSIQAIFVIHMLEASLKP